MKITKFECVEVEECAYCPYFSTLNCEFECTIDGRRMEEIYSKPKDCPYNKEMDKEVWHEIIGVLINR